MENQPPGVCSVYAESCSVTWGPGVGGGPYGPYGDIRSPFERPLGRARGPGRIRVLRIGSEGMVRSGDRDTTGAEKNNFLVTIRGMNKARYMPHTC
jgi:hypothetical protein